MRSVCLHKMRDGTQKHLDNGRASYSHRCSHLMERNGTRTGNRDVAYIEFSALSALFALPCHTFYLGYSHCLDFLPCLSSVVFCRYIDTITFDFFP